MKEDIKTLFRMMGQLGYVLSAKQKRASLLVLLSIMVGAVLDLLGVSIIIPFIQAMLDPVALCEIPAINLLLTWLHIPQDYVIILVAIGIVLIYFIKNGYLVFSGAVQVWFRTRVQKELSVTMMNSYMGRPYAYFVNTHSSEILRGIDADIKNVYLLLAHLTGFATSLFTILVISLLLVYLNPWMTLCILAMAAACFVVVTISFKAKLKNAGESNRHALAGLNRYAYQAINGIKEISVMQRRAYFVKSYEAAHEEYRKANNRVDVLSVLPDRIIESCCVAVLIGVVTFMVAIAPAQAAELVPSLGAFALSAFRILPLIGALMTHLNYMSFFRPSLEATYNNLREAREYETERTAYAHANADDGAELHFAKSLTVEHVTWQYPNAAEPVLRDLSLTVNKGEMIGLIGASGAGKTTLADVILGLFQPQEGKVRVDGADVYAALPQWSKMIGYVPQSVFLVDDSIRNNVAFGLAAEQVDDARVWRALEQAQLRSFVEGLPRGLDTPVGERGVKFSGGQRQRVAIARALYYDPDILVLDEATAALDNETETAVMESIDSLQRDKTLIIVAHRLSTIRNCDRILEVKDGKAVERDKAEVLAAQ